MKQQTVEVTLRPGSSQETLSREMKRHNRPFFMRKGEQIVRIFREAYSPHRVTGKLDRSFDYAVEEQGDELILRAGIIDNDSQPDTLDFRSVQTYILPLEYGSQGPAQIYGNDFHYGRESSSRIYTWAMNRGVSPFWVKVHMREHGTKPANKWPEIVMNIENVLSKRGFE